MRASRSLSVASAALSLFVVLVAAKPVSNLGGPVSATFRCPTTVDCVSADRIEGDSLGAYATAADDFINGIGDLQLYLRAGGGRSWFLDFTQPDGVAPCVSASTACRMNFVTTTRPSGVLLVNATTATDVELTNGLYDIPIGATGYGRLMLNFPDPSGRAYLWTIRFNPGAYAGSTSVHITRVATNEWVIEATAQDRARLVATTTSGRQVMTDEGLYVMPFRLHVVK